MFRVLTTDGSILSKSKNFKKSLFLKVDKNNSFTWKSLLHMNIPNSVQKFEKFKTRFLK